MKRILSFILGILSLPLYAQRIDDAVILHNDAVFTVVSRDKATFRHEIEIFITKTGAKYADFSCSVNDGSSKLTAFSGTIKQADGKIVKIKKKDLSLSEYSEGLADSYKTWYYTPDIKEYPVTITYSYEKQYTDAIIVYDSFIPLPYGDGVSVKEASYTLKVPSKDYFQYQQSHISDPEHYTTKDGEVFVWKIENIPAMKYEPYSPPLYSRIPKVIFSSNEFSYEGKEGSAKDWTSIGNWLISLTEDRCTPSAELQEIVDRITNGSKNELEKIQKIYKYLGENTRYVSIQLGLGGLQPISPDNVLRNKFGDCKALAFFMQTMLKCCDIDSYYTIINLGEDRMTADFPSLGTSNHVILYIPTAKDTLWIECTNPEIPLGYIHDGIAGNHALIVKKDSSYVTRLPMIPDSKNGVSKNAAIHLNPDGSATAFIEEQAFMDFWEDYHYLSKASESDKANSIISDISLPRAKVSNIITESNDTPEPSYLLNYTIDANSYAGVTGSRLFVPTNPFRDIEARLSSDKRINELYFKNGYWAEDTITITIPEGYIIEAAPKDTEYSNDLGAIKFNYIELNPAEIQLKFKFTRNSGTFPNSKYDDYKKLIHEASSVFNSKIVLVTLKK